MQYKIPQNVGIEDKIVGPLSLRQLIIVAVGTGISWVLFAIMSKLYEVNFIEYAVIAMPALLSAAFALIRINDQSLTKYLQLLMEFSMKPKRRVWDHRGIASLVAPDLGEPVTAEASTMNSDLLAKSKKASNLRQLSLVLDSGGFEHVKAPVHKDMDQAQDENLVTQAYFGNDEKEKMNMYWRTIESHKKRLDFFAKLPTTKLVKGSAEAELARTEIAKAKEAGETARKLTLSVNVRLKPTTPSTPPASAPKTQSPRPAPQPPKPAAPKPTIQPPKNEPSNARPSSVKTSEAPTPKPTPQPPTQKTPEKAVTQPVLQTQSPAPKPQTAPNPVPKAVAPQNSGTQPSAAKPSPTTPTPIKPNDRKQSPQPVRQGHVNTTNKNVPAQYIPKTMPKPQPQQKPPVRNPAPLSREKPKETQPKPSAPSNSGEFKFEELKKGEIEINLD
jgi:hypothetical protein